MATRSQILVRGIVQGVGFRPFVYSQANRRALRGRVLNDASGVVIDVEGNAGDIEQFVLELASNPPPLSSIESIECNNNLGLANYREFRIVESDLTGRRFVPLSPDIATCDDCLKELFDPRDRRYRYPFINCTNCGPRFTIIEDIPYDRSRTTMRDFVMCSDCEAEYTNPLDRRFHAEPTACAACGPRLFLVTADGREIVRGDDDGISRARQLLSEGGILAIKGIGGFHLACDALNREAVERLRRRKYREDKPFALMASSLDLVRNHCYLSEPEMNLLNSEQRPIVLLEKKPYSDIPRAVAPAVNNLGFMLPYSALHHLLLQDLDRPLVLTSGNVSDEPISYENEEALRYLRNIADYFLLHDRRIHVRSDDSVTRVSDGHALILRRSRGYAPAPIKTRLNFEQEILACGAELKNTFCLARGNYAFVSHHIGDLENLETLKSFTEGIEHFKRLFYLQPEVIAYDLHPEYLSTKYALGLDDNLPKIGVQHHHAHVASCLADNGAEGDVIGVVFDGLGFGTDGRLWGGEFLVVNYEVAERVAHLDYVPLPGGGKAIREPWRMAAVYVHRALGDEFLKLNLPFTRDLDHRAWATLKRMTATGTNSPETSSMGRLFDAVSSLIGVRNKINYEGQAAIELEMIADRQVGEAYQFEIDADGSVIRAEKVIQRAVEDLLSDVPACQVSARFHLGVVHLISEVAKQVRSARRVNRVALSGGVFQNMFLLEQTCRLLRAEGFEVLTHQRVPPNDGGISLGQAVVANAQLAARRI
jgi:hydrogenase maturation protein HypF